MTDSSVQLTKEEIEKYDITVVPQLMANRMLMESILLEAILSKR